MPNAPQSPCIGLCQLDASRVCLGCGRHIDEVVEWAFVDEARKQEILSNARRRISLIRPGAATKEDLDDPAGPQ